MTWLLRWSRESRGKRDKEMRSLDKSTHMNRKNFWRIEDSRTVENVNKSSQSSTSRQFRTYIDQYCPIITYNISRNCNNIQFINRVIFHIKNSLINYSYLKYFTVSESLIWILKMSNEPIEMQDFLFENLPPAPPLDNSTLNLIDSKIRGENWIESHQCITGIRSIHKEHPECIFDMMQRYDKAILEIITKGKTQMLKNIFRMLKEIYLMGKTVNVEFCVYAFLP